MSDIAPAIRLFAAVGPSTRNRRRWIAEWTVSRQARSARIKAAEGWPAGWDDLKAKGWTIERVDIVPSQVVVRARAPKAAPHV